MLPKPREPPVERRWQARERPEYRVDHCRQRAHVERDPERDEAQDPDDLLQPLRQGQYRLAGTIAAAPTTGQAAASSVNDEKRCADLRRRPVRFRIVCNLITHAGPKREDATVLEFGVEFAADAQEYMALTTPVIGFVSG